ncbi:prolipoprotein diacylglyceryl transferase [Thermospira aquatica]|uniref:Phosphatidylglycerol--prolipoprotein diacylglyceryl transferase n=1 Tax=Thermospira aquatica TaxID=2828656 RepID=A0AAX3BE93_9SPIR|nr:prolipoprotein diacylglyceryl transferase [Thermospira aquatica]URA10374.1 prolipoprotein diacylglyceryl transferase [Thermospira aquatica]
MFAYIIHNLSNEIFSIYGPIVLRWYGLMYLVGFGVNYYLLSRWIKTGKIKLTQEFLSDTAVTIMIFIVIGARIGYMLFYNFSGLMANPLTLFAVWEGGMSFHGGVLFGFLLSWIYFTWKKQNFWDLADVFIVAIPLALFFGRIGNFINGELWGAVTTLPWGVIFPTVPLSRWQPLSDPAVQEMVKKIALPIDGTQPYITIVTEQIKNHFRLPYEVGEILVNLPRHPSQLYEAFGEGIVLFLILYTLFRKGVKIRGVYLWTFFVGYGMIRFLVEFIRQPDIHIGYLYGNWFTMGMLLSLPMIMVGIVGLGISISRKKVNSLWG